MPVHRPHIAKLVLTLALAGLTAAPAAAQTAGGGAAAPDSASDGPGATVSPGPTPVPSGPIGGPELQADPVGMLGRIVHFRGSLGAGAAFQPLTIERYDSDGGTWKRVSKATADSAGTFTAAWRANRVGIMHLRARLSAGSRSADSRSADSHSAHSADVPAVDITVFRGQYATWFGEGFYGKETACGVVLTHHTLGVAHRTLPCGTPVQILYGGHTITVPVVDRGPYGGRASWDLTEATAKTLGFDGNELIGVMRSTAPPTPIAGARTARHRG